MSEQQPELLKLNEEDVLHYLKQNPNLFERHPDALAEIKIPHAHKGSISLMERQQEVLRHKNQDMEKQIKDLLSTAKQNEKIYRAFVNLYMALLECPDSQKLLYLLRAMLLDQIELDGIKLCLFITTTDEKAQDFVEPRSKFLDVLDDRLSRDTYYFGRLKQQEMDLFFEPEKAIGSVCLIRLGEQKDLGILAFGSCDDNHFSPDMDTVFLDPMVKLINRFLFDFQSGERS
ncbi:DUF484 domain-containing protein [Saccharobesus litoralis]|uniref:DUF484 domain-containing protein n=1 Tax=Saccharobesus litoralis TaxID=2172099 RepID=A0A2S0VQ73_9ALTE|nr:DUF484 family protein [Saccharobesus litoralis]AWB66366.1 DUF484 domain-containing protein [Saccharobesus litoralis]